MGTFLTVQWPKRSPPAPPQLEWQPERAGARAGRQSQVGAAGELRGPRLDQPGPAHSDRSGERAAGLGQAVRRGR